MAEGTKDQVFSRVFELRASPEELWTYVSDTDKVNQALGMDPVVYVNRPHPQGGIRRMATTRLGGFRVEWEEPPFEWQAPHRFGVRRAYTRGPLALMEIDHRFEALPGGGTRVTLSFTFRPRNLLGQLMARVAGAKAPADFERVYREVDAFLAGEAARVFHADAASPPSVHGDRLRAIVADLRVKGFPESMTDALSKLILTGQDWELAKIRPLELARSWGFDRREVLKLFLHATKLGLFEMRWDLLCPGCRGATGSTSSLSSLSGEIHCEACNIDTSADFGQSVELSFKPNPAVRKVESAEFCIGGPGRTPHVVYQVNLEAGRPVEADLVLKPGTYRLRSPQVAGHMAVIVHEDEGPDSAVTRAMHLTAEGFQPSHLDLNGSPLRLRFESALSCQLTLERTDWAQNVVTGAYVSTLQEFRDLFSSEVLAPGLQLAVTRVAILFTDLKSSTAMYEQLGDATAFSIVQAHFRILEQAIANNQGAILKTVGDAIMAAFYDPADCVRASFELQAGVDRYNRDNPDKAAPIIVKLGAHVGPCIAVTANEHLDYFGTTVNLAARVQNEAVGEDIVLSEPLLKDPGVQQVLESFPVRERAPFEVKLKGLSDCYTLTRFYPDYDAIKAMPTKRRGMGALV